MMIVCRFSANVSGLWDGKLLKGDVELLVNKEDCFSFILIYHCFSFNGLLTKICSYATENIFNEA